MNFIIVILYIIVICEIIMINKLSNDLALLWKKFDKMHSKNQRMMSFIEETQHTKRFLEDDCK